MLRKLTSGVTGFEGFTRSSRIATYSMTAPCVFGGVPPGQVLQQTGNPARHRGSLAYLRSHGEKPRYRSNRLLFLAPDHTALSRLRDGLRTYLAWASIVEDVKDGRLNIDRLQEQQAQKELRTAEESCRAWPATPTAGCCAPIRPRRPNASPPSKPSPLTASGSTLSAEIERVCQENELIITAWSPIHLRQQLRDCILETLINRP